jgi:hypothetical protein
VITPIPHARRMNLIALALLVTALISLVAFHLLPFDPSLSTTHPSENRGWIIWRFIGSVFSSGRIFRAPDAEALAFGCLPVSMMLVIAAPFLIPMLRGSRPIWWMMMIMTSVCLASVSWLIWSLSRDPITTPPPSISVYVMAVFLNFLGLLFIRREVPAAPEVDPA